MATIKSKNKSVVKVTIHNAPVELELFARRGAVLYGVCTTIRNSVSLVELIELGGDEYEVHDVKSITFNDQQRMPAILENNVRCTVGCFVCNAHLDEKFPDLKGQVTAKVLALIAKIPKAETYATFTF